MVLRLPAIAPPKHLCVGLYRKSDPHPPPKARYSVQLGLGGPSPQRDRLNEHYGFVILPGMILLVTEAPLRKTPARFLYVSSLGGWRCLDAQLFWWRVCLFWGRPEFLEFPISGRRKVIRP